MEIEKRIVGADNIKRTDYEFQPQNSFEQTKIKVAGKLAKGKSRVKHIRLKKSVNGVADKMVQQKDLHKYGVESVDYKIISRNDY